VRCPVEGCYDLRLEVVPLTFLREEGLGHSFVASVVSVSYVINVSPTSPTNYPS